MERDELISRRLELQFNEQIVAGPRTEQVVAELKRRGAISEADQLSKAAPKAPVTAPSALTVNKARASTLTWMRFRKTLSTV